MIPRGAVRSHARTHALAGGVAASSERSSPNLTAMSDDAAAAAAAAKREARKRKILERGGDRLSRITHTGRGKDYEGLESTPVKTMPTVETTHTSSDVAVSEPQPVRLPSEIIGTKAPASVAPSPALAEGDPADPIAQMLASLQQGSEGGGMPNDPMAMLQQLMSATKSQAGMPPQVPGMSLAESARMERTMRRVRLWQATLVFLFAFYIVFSSIFSHATHPGITGRTLPTDASHGFARDTFFRQWASLARKYTPMSEWLSADDPSVFPWGALRTPMDSMRPYIGDAVVDGEWPAWPVFWVFASMEIGLQGIRLAMLQRRPAALPGRLSTIASRYAPAPLRSILPLGASLLSLLSSLVDDLCILLFAIGLGVLFCHVWAPTA